MTKNKLNTGDLWFNPSNPEKLVVFKKPKLTDNKKILWRLQITNSN